MMMKFAVLLALALVPGPAAASWRSDPSSVEAATIHWINTVTSGAEDAPAETAALYAEDAVLWGSVSGQLRVGHEQILEYFNYFARCPGLTVVDGSFLAEARILGHMAISSGYYTFAMVRDGKTVQVPARFTFVYRAGPNGWEIVDHHSSMVPKRPDELPRLSPRLGKGARMAKSLPKTNWREDPTTVEAATREWIATVTSGTEDAPEKTTSLYADNAVLWGTVSGQLRSGSDQILEYFKYFARCPELAVVDGSFSTEARICGSLAISSGYYTFSMKKNGKVVQVPGRFTFVYKAGERGWEIVDHHSSMVPKQPDKLPRLPAASLPSPVGRKF